MLETETVNLSRKEKFFIGGLIEVWKDEPPKTLCDAYKEAAGFNLAMLTANFSPETSDFLAEVAYKRAKEVNRRQRRLGNVSD